jgi:cytoskeleton protein RodZ
LKTDAPSVVVAEFPCAVCGAWLDRLHLDPGPDRSLMCSFCGAPQPPIESGPNGNGSRTGSSNGLHHLSLVEASDVLREERERRGESLEEVSVVTGINLRYLEDLEGGDASFEPYPGRVYGRFFLREYAEHLGLDPEPMVEAFDGETGSVLPVEPTLGVGRTARRSFLRPLATVVGVLLLIAGAVAFRLTQDDASVPGPRTPAASTPLDATPPVAANEPPADETTVHGIRAVVHVTGRCWIEAISDGTTTFMATKEAGTVLRLRADRRLELTLGNAGGVNLVVNGHRVATGPTADVAHLVLVLRGNEVRVSRA